jgi:tRNA pseudouridine38-40 synthase
VQPGQRTVQGVLQEVLSQVSGAAVRLTVAGRTDAGVHALGQVAHADIPAPVWAAFAGSLDRRLAAMLPEDVRVNAVQPAPPGFDARFSALWRRYEYRITDRESGAAPLTRHAILPWRRHLDADAMAQAARALLGEHDFAAYCRRRAGATTIREIERFDVVRVGDEVLCTVQADAFCHSMVRSLVGALLAVGDGRQPVSWPAALLARTTRADDVSVAAARGLTLIEVGYPADADLGARASFTRRVRVPLSPPQTPR